jgi:putative endonuclease
MDNEIWHVYIIECKDSKLYVGIAKDVEKRVLLHNKGIACRFTKYRHPVKLLYQEQCLNHALAAQRESEIKGFSKKKKLQLINKDPSA